MQPFRKDQVKNISSERGAILIAIIISMVVLAIVGATVYTLSSTSALNQAEAQKAAKAYYLSESCVRIAASEYKAAANTEKISTLINLQNRTFDMPDNQGSCKIIVYPYWFYASTGQSCVSGQTDCKLTLYFPGERPPVDENGTKKIKMNLTSGMTGKLKKKGKSPDVYVFTSASLDDSFTANTGTKAIFTLKSAVTVTAGDEFYLGYDFSGATLAGGNLNLVMPVAEAAAAVMFPPEKGMIFLEEKDSCIRPDGKYDPIIYSYELRDVSQTGTLRLTGLQYQGTCPTVPAPFTGAAKTIYIGKNIAFQSKSQYGN